MELSLYTWNGIAINDGSVFRASIKPGQMANLRANIISVPRANDFPFVSGTALPQHVFVIGVDVLPGNTIDAKRELLKQYFSITDKQRHNLIAKDTNDSNRQWYLTGFPTSISPTGNSKISFDVVITTEMPVWRVVTPLTSTLSATASGQTVAVTNIGNQPVAPVYTLTPTTAKTGGLAYRRFVPIYNNLDVSFSAPFDVTSRNATGGGFDTATLTTTKMQADGDDFRVWIDGAEAERWLSGMDTATTQCWVNLNLSPRHEAVLVTSLSATAGVTEIEVAHTKVGKTFIRAMATTLNKVVLIESEVFTFTAANEVTYKLTGVTTARKDTTAADHTAGATVRHIEHDLWILYGDSTLSAPDVNDDNKPMFDLTSTNAALAYTYFYDTDAPRPGAWKGEVIDSKTGLSYCYTADLNTFVSPSTKLGLSLTGSPSAYNMLSETGTLAWSLTHPAGVTTVVYSGDKYAVNSWPAIAGLQYLQTNTAWFTADNNNIPTTLYAWEALGPSTYNFASPYPASIRFAMDGSLSPYTGEHSLIQFDTVTVSVDSTKLPTASIGTETAINFFDFTLTNNTTTEYIKVQTPCLVNSALVVDCDAKRAYLADGSRVAVTLSTSRDAWLDLRAGVANTMQLDETGLNAVTFLTSHVDRNI